MKITKKIPEDGHIILSITGEITIYSSRGFKDMLLKFLSEAWKLELDLSGIGKIDTAGFQVLLLARREAALDNKEFFIVNPSPETRRLFSLYGEQFGSMEPQ